MPGNDRIFVLLVEDNPGDAFVIRRKLPAFDVMHVSSLAGALQAIDKQDKEDFAVILLDLNLPDSKGLDTINALRAKVTCSPKTQPGKTRGAPVR